MKLEKKVYTTTSEKRKDLFIGVGILIGLNVLLNLGQTGIMYLVYNIPQGSDASIKDTAATLGMCLMSVLPFLVNIAVIIYFALTRSWIALGMLGAIAILFALTLLAIIVSLVACFLLPNLFTGNP